MLKSEAAQGFYMEWWRSRSPVRTKLV